ncbi:MAG: hypoxanthine phosphoribosyltransferase [Planctomycetia bacterium]|nr:hypoxanthine phosphoribosyltransferase [Planctomycetia bacterium]
MDLLIPADRIAQRINEIAGRIQCDYSGRPVVVVGVLTGCLVFLSDLVRRIDLPLRIHLIQASSYRGETTTPGQLELRLDGLPDLLGRDVLVIDDILDTGQTLHRIITELHRRGPTTLRVAVLLRKSGRQAVALEPDYVGFEIPDAFVVGYGLDYNDEYRHLPHIAVLHPSEH